MGNIDAATRLRQNEGLGMSTLGTGLNTLGAQSYATNFINQLRSQTGGQADPWVSLFSGMLGQGATAYSKTAVPGSTPPSVLNGGGIGGQTWGSLLNAGQGPDD
jgi:hypothetical protein